MPPRLLEVGRNLNKADTEGLKQCAYYFKQLDQVKLCNTLLFFRNKSHAHVKIVSPLQFEVMFTVYRDMTQKANPIRDSPLLRSARRSFASLQKSRQNHGSYVWIEALSSMVFVPSSVFVPAQKISGILPCLSLRIMALHEKALHN